MKGGRRLGAGRKRGSKTQKVSETALRAAELGITPLEYMLQIMRNEPPEDADALTKLGYQSMRFDAAKGAAPYVHPRLNAIEHTGKDGGPIQAKVTVEFISKAPGSV